MGLGGAVVAGFLGFEAVEAFGDMDGDGGSGGDSGSYGDDSGSYGGDSGSYGGDSGTGYGGDSGGCTDNALSAQTDMYNAAQESLSLDAGFACQDAGNF